MDSDDDVEIIEDVEPIVIEPKSVFPYVPYEDENEVNFGHDHQENPAQVGASHLWQGSMPAAMQEHNVLPSETRMHPDHGTSQIPPAPQATEQWRSSVPSHNQRYSIPNQTQVNRNSSHVQKERSGHTSVAQWYFLNKDFRAVSIILRQMGNTYSCSYCTNGPQSVWNTAADFRDHVSDHVQGLKAVIHRCPLCNYTNNLTGVVKTHMRKEHRNLTFLIERLQDIPVETQVVNIVMERLDAGFRVQVDLGQIVQEALEGQNQRVKRMLESLCNWVRRSAHGTSRGSRSDRGGNIASQNQIHPPGIPNSRFQQSQMPATATSSQRPSIAAYMHPSMVTSHHSQTETSDVGTLYPNMQIPQHGVNLQQPAVPYPTRGSQTAPNFGYINLPHNTNLAQTASHMVPAEPRILSAHHHHQHQAQRSHGPRQNQCMAPSWHMPVDQLAQTTATHHVHGNTGTAGNVMFQAQPRVPTVEGTDSSRVWSSAEKDPSSKGNVPQAQPRGSTLEDTNGSRNGSVVSQVQQTIPTLGSTYSSIIERVLCQPGRPTSGDTNCSRNGNVLSQSTQENANYSRMERTVETDTRKIDSVVSQAHSRLPVQGDANFRRIGSSVETNSSGTESVLSAIHSRLLTSGDANSGSVGTSMKMCEQTVMNADQFSLVNQKQIYPGDKDEKCDKSPSFKSSKHSVLAQGSVGTTADTPIIIEDCASPEIDIPESPQKTSESNTKYPAEGVHLDSKDTPEGEQMNAKKTQEVRQFDTSTIGDILAMPIDLTMTDSETQSETPDAQTSDYVSQEESPAWAQLKENMTPVGTALSSAEISEQKEDHPKGLVENENTELVCDTTKKSEIVVESESTQGPQNADDKSKESEVAAKSDETTGSETAGDKSKEAEIVAKSDTKRPEIEDDKSKETEFCATSDKTKVSEIECDKVNEVENVTESDETKGSEVVCDSGSVEEATGVEDSSEGKKSEISACSDTERPSVSVGESTGKTISVGKCSFVAGFYTCFCNYKTQHDKSFRRHLFKHIHKKTKGKCEHCPDVPFNKFAYCPVLDQWMSLVNNLKVKAEQGELTMLKSRRNSTADKVKDRRMSSERKWVQDVVTTESDGVDEEAAELLCIQDEKSTTENTKTQTTSAHAPPGEKGGNENTSMNLVITSVVGSYTSSNKTSVTENSNTVDGNKTPVAGNSNKSPELISCFTCSFRSFSQKIMDVHDKCHQSIQNRNHNFLCKLCPFSANYLEEFKEHLYYHPGVHKLTVWQCIYCSMCTADRARIVADHVESEHRRRASEMECNNKNITGYSVEQLLAQFHTEEEGHAERAATCDDVLKGQPGSSFQVPQSTLQGQNETITEELAPERASVVQKSCAIEAENSSEEDKQQKIKHFYSKGGESPKDIGLEIQSIQPREDLKKSERTYKLLTKTKFECLYCCQPFAMMPAFIDHLKEHVFEDEQRVALYRCGKCHLYSTSQTYVKTHQQVDKECATSDVVDGFIELRKNSARVRMNPGSLHRVKNSPRKLQKQSVAKMDNSRPKTNHSERPAVESDLQGDETPPLLDITGEEVVAINSRELDELQDKTTNNQTVGVNIGESEEQTKTANEQTVRGNLGESERQNPSEKPLKTSTENQGETDSESDSKPVQNPTKTDSKPSVEKLWMAGKKTSIFEKFSEVLKKEVAKRKMGTDTSSNEGSRSNSPVRALNMDRKENSRDLMVNSRGAEVVPVLSLFGTQTEVLPCSVPQAGPQKFHSSTLQAGKPQTENSGSPGGAFDLEPVSLPPGSDMYPQTQEDDDNNELSCEFPCDSCDFTSTDLDQFTLHIQSHWEGTDHATASRTSSPQDSEHVEFGMAEAGVESPADHMQETQDGGGSHITGGRDSQGTPKPVQSEVTEQEKTKAQQDLDLLRRELGYKTPPPVEDGNIITTDFAAQTSFSDDISITDEDEEFDQEESHISDTSAKGQGPGEHGAKETSPTATSMDSGQNSTITASQKPKSEEGVTDSMESHTQEWKTDKDSQNLPSPINHSSPQRPEWTGTEPGNRPHPGPAGIAGECRSPEAAFTCDLCEFATPDLEQFVAHVQSHSDDVTNNNDEPDRYQSEEGQEDQTHHVRVSQQVHRQSGDCSSQAQAQSEDCSSQAQAQSEDHSSQAQAQSKDPSSDVHGQSMNPSSPAQTSSEDPASQVQFQSKESSRQTHAQSKEPSSEALAQSENPPCQTQVKTDSSRQTSIQSKEPSSQELNQPGEYVRQQVSHSHSDSAVHSDGCPGKMLASPKSYSNLAVADSKMDRNQETSQPEDLNYSQSNVDKKTSCSDVQHEDPTPNVQEASSGRASFTFKCYMCGYGTEDMAVFAAHVGSHNEDISQTEKPRHVEPCDQISSSGTQPTGSGLPSKEPQSQPSCEALAVDGKLPLKESSEPSCEDSSDKLQSDSKCPEMLDMTLNDPVPPEQSSGEDQSEEDPQSAFGCDFCDFKTDDIEYFTKHVESHSQSEVDGHSHLDQPDDDQVLNCTEPQSLMESQSVDLQSTRDTEDHKYKDADGPYLYDKCDFQTVNLTQLDSHVKSHLEEGDTAEQLRDSEERKGNVHDNTEIVEDAKVDFHKETDDMKINTEMCEKNSQNLEKNTEKCDIKMDHLESNTEDQDKKIKKFEVDTENSQNIVDCRPGRKTDSSTHPAESQDSEDLESCKVSEDSQVINVSENLFQCDFCVFKTDSLDQFSEHTELHMNKIQSPQLSIPEDSTNPEVQTRRGTDNHQVDRVSDKMYKCDLCVFKSEDIEEFTKHACSQTNTAPCPQKPAEDSTEPAESQNSKFQNSSFSGSPEVDDVSNDKCQNDICIFTAHNLKQSSVHAESPLTDLQCPQQSDQDSSKPQLENSEIQNTEVSEDHQVDNVSEDIYPCDICDFETNDLEQFCGHIQLHNDKSQGPQSSSPEHSTGPEIQTRKVIEGTPVDNVSDRLFKCDTCVFKTEDVHEFSMHALSHTNITAHSQKPAENSANPDESQNSAFQNGTFSEDPQVDVSGDIIENDMCTTVSLEQLSRDAESHTADLQCPQQSDQDSAQLVQLETSKIQDNHHQVDNVSEDLHQCDICEFESNDLQQFSEHTELHKKQLQCPQPSIPEDSDDPEIQTKKGTLDPEVNSVSDKLFKCEMCVFKTEDIDEFSKHAELHTDATPHSQKPAEDSATPDESQNSTFQNSTFSEDPQVDVVSDDIIENDMCTYKTVSLEHVSGDAESHTTNLQCSQQSDQDSANPDQSENDEIQKTKVSEDQVDGISEDLDQCEICVSEANDLEQFSEHTELHKNKPEQPQLPPHEDSASSEIKTRKFTEDSQMESVSDKMFGGNMFVFKTDNVEQFSKHAVSHITEQQCPRQPGEHSANPVESQDADIQNSTVAEEANVDSISDYLFQCGMCSFKTKDHEQFSKHAESHAKEPKALQRSVCEGSSKPVDSPNLEIQNSKACENSPVDSASDKPFECDMCILKTEDAEVSSKHAESPVSEPPCLQQQDSASHIELQNSETPSSTISDDPKVNCVSDGLLKCDICAFKTGDHEEFTWHLESHKRRSCDISLSTKDVEDARPLKVPDLPNQPEFQSLTALNRRDTNEQNGDSGSLHKCHVCEFQTMDLEQFSNHVQLHEEIETTETKNQHAENSQNVLQLDSEDGDIPHKIATAGSLESHDTHVESRPGINSPDKSHDTHVESLPVTKSPDRSHDTRVESLPVTKSPDRSHDTRVESLPAVSSPERSHDTHVESLPAVSSPERSHDMHVESLPAVSSPERSQDMHVESLPAISSPERSPDTHVESLPAISCPEESLCIQAESPMSTRALSTEVEPVGMATVSPGGASSPVRSQSTTAASLLTASSSVGSHGIPSQSPMTTCTQIESQGTSTCTSLATLAKNAQNMHPPVGSEGNVGETPVATLESVSSQRTPTCSPVRSEDIPTLSPIGSQSTPPLSPVRSEGIPTLSPVRSQGTPCMSPVRSEGTPNMSPARSDSTPYMSPVRSDSTPNMSPVRSDSTPIMSPVRSDSTPNMSPVRSEGAPNMSPVRSDGAQNLRGSNATPTNSPEEANQFNCDRCDFVSKNVKKIAVHLQGHIQDQLNQLPQQPERSQETPFVQSRSQETPFVQCRDLPNQEEPATSVRPPCEVAVQSMGSETGFKCDFCEFTATDIEKFVQHVQLHDEDPKVVAQTRDSHTVNYAQVMHEIKPNLRKDAEDILRGHRTSPNPKCVTADHTEAQNDEGVGEGHQTSFNLKSSMEGHTRSQDIEGTSKAHDMLQTHRGETGECAELCSSEGIDKGHKSPQNFVEERELTTEADLLVQDFKNNNQEDVSLGCKPDMSVEPESASGLDRLQNAGHDIESLTEAETQQQDAENIDHEDETSGTKPHSENVEAESRSDEEKLSGVADFKDTEKQSNSEESIKEELQQRKSSLEDSVFGSNKKPDHLYGRTYERRKSKKSDSFGEVNQTSSGESSQNANDQSSLDSTAFEEDLLMSSDPDHDKMEDGTISSSLSHVGNQTKETSRLEPAPENQESELLSSEKSEMTPQDVIGEQTGENQSEDNGNTGDIAGGNNAESCADGTELRSDLYKSDPQSEALETDNSESEISKNTQDIQPADTEEQQNKNICDKEDKTETPVCTVVCSDSTRGQSIRTETMCSSLREDATNLCDEEASHKKDMSIESEGNDECVSLVLKKSDEQDELSGSSRDEGHSGKSGAHDEIEIQGTSTSDMQETASEARQESVLTHCESQLSPDTCHGEQSHDSVNNIKDKRELGGHGNQDDESSRTKLDSSPQHVPQKQTSLDGVQMDAHRLSEKTDTDLIKQQMDPEEKSKCTTKLKFMRPWESENDVEKGACDRTEKESNLQRESDNLATENTTKNPSTDTGELPDSTSKTDSAEIDIKRSNETQITDHPDIKSDAGTSDLDRQNKKSVDVEKGKSSNTGDDIAAVQDTKGENDGEVPPPDEDSDNGDVNITSSGMMLMRAHSGGKCLKCSYCSYSCKRNMMLMRHHIYKSHVGSYPFSCPVCSHGTLALGEIVQHMRKKHQGCQLRLSKVRRRDLAEIVPLKVTETEVLYGLSGFKGGGTEDLNKEADAQPSTSRPVTRKRKFSSVDQGTKSDRVPVNSIPDKLRKVESETEKANVSSPKPASFTPERRTSTSFSGQPDYFRCKCGHETRERKNMRDHVVREIGELPYQCFKCNIRVLRPSELMAHFKAEHPKNKYRPVYVFGEKAKLKVRKLLDSYAVYIDPSNCDSSEIKVPNSSKKATPGASKKTTNQPRKRKMTGDISTGESPVAKLAKTEEIKGGWKCPKCPFIAEERGDLYQHIMEVELQYIPYYCGHCSENHCLLSHMKEHHNTAHPGLQPMIIHRPNQQKAKALKKLFEQEIIIEASEGQGATAVHEAQPCRGDESSAVSKYQCRECPYNTAGRDRMRLHIHAELQYRPFKCNQCSYSAVIKHNVMSHQKGRVHQGSKAPLWVIEKRIRKMELEVEKRMAESLLTSLDVTASNQTDRKSKESSREPTDGKVSKSGVNSKDVYHKCKTCGHTTSDIYGYTQMRNHVLRLHAPNRFECGVCAFKCRTRVKVMTHMTEEHPESRLPYKRIPLPNNQTVKELMQTMVEMKVKKPRKLSKASVKDEEEGEGDTSQASPGRKTKSGSPGKAEFGGENKAKNHARGKSYEVKPQEKDVFKQYKIDSEGFYCCLLCDWRKLDGKHITEHMRRNHLPPRWRCVYCPFENAYRSTIHQHYKMKSHRGKDILLIEIENGRLWRGPKWAPVPEGEKVEIIPISDLNSSDGGNTSMEAEGIPGGVPTGTLGQTLAAPVTGDTPVVVSVCSIPESLYTDLGSSEPSADQSAVAETGCTKGYTDNAPTESPLDTCYSSNTMPANKVKMKPDQPSCSSMDSSGFEMLPRGNINIEDCDSVDSHSGMLSGTVAPPGGQMGIFGNQPSTSGGYYSISGRAKTPPGASLGIKGGLSVGGGYYSISSKDCTSTPKTHGVTLDPKHTDPSPDGTVSKQNKADTGVMSPKTSAAVKPFKCAHCGKNFSLCMQARMHCKKIHPDLPIAIQELNGRGEAQDVQNVTNRSQTVASERYKEATNTKPSVVMKDVVMSIVQHSQLS